MSNEVIISGVHIELTEALKNLVSSKTRKLLHHDKHIIRIRVELEEEKNKAHEGEFVAKGTVEVNGPDIHASAASNDLYKSIDLLIEKLDRQLTESLKKIHESHCCCKREIAQSTDL